MALLSDDLRRLAYWHDRATRDGFALTGDAARDFGRLLHQAVDKAEALERGVAPPPASLPPVGDARLISIARGEEEGVVLFVPRERCAASSRGGPTGGGAA